MLTQNLEGCLTTLPLSQFIDDAIELIEDSTQFARLKEFQAVSAGSKRNYRSILMRFLNWIKQSNRYLSLANELSSNHAPQLSTR